MKKLILSTLLCLFSTSVFAEQDKAKDNIIKKMSPHSVSVTMDKFEAIIKKKGFTVFARVDHQKNAKTAEMEMNPAQVIIFGNPKGGTVLMKQDMAIALDLPLRVAVYKDADNKVYIAYHHPTAMSAPYKLENNPVIPKLSKGLDKLTALAIEK